MNRTAAPGAGTATAGGDLWWYFAGAYAWTWALWIPAALAERGTLAVPVPVVLLQILGGLGPMGAAIAIAARRSGRTGVGDLFRQLRLRGLPRRWLVAAAAVGLLDVAPALVYLASGGSLLVAVVAHSAADVFDGLRFAIIDDPGWALRSDLVQMVAMVVAAVALTFVTKGRLGADPTPAPALRWAGAAMR